MPTSPDDVWVDGKAVRLGPGVKVDDTNVEEDEHNCKLGMRIIFFPTLEYHCLLSNSALRIEE